MNKIREKLLERFLRYVRIDTQSDESRADKVHPSTSGQWDLLRMLEKELKDAGLTDVCLDEYGYLLARIPANVESVPAVGFGAHVDTASDVKGNGVKPCVVENWDGKDILLKAGNSIKVAENPELADYRGKTLVVSDGSTLLGSDDKAGVSIIMSMVDFLTSNPDVKHGEIEILFSPDEETGHGMDFFDVKRLHSEAFYTVDGSSAYYIEDECFNAATFKVKFIGVPRHLGDARGVMVNALTMCSHFVASLPQSQSPEATDGRYGYYCPYLMSGGVSDAELAVLVRDFDSEGLNRRIKVLEKLSDTVCSLYGGKSETEYKISYKNMHMASKKDPRAVKYLLQAGELLGQNIKREIIRGGTDGARIAEYGIPCPNIYTGGHNLHSCLEWVSLDAMYESFELITETVKKWAESV